MANKSNDPVALWQNMIGEMEKEFNAFANQAMASPEFSKVVNQVGGVTAGAQKQVSELMEKYLLSMNLPSRSPMLTICARLGRFMLRRYFSMSSLTCFCAPAVTPPT